MLWLIRSGLRAVVARCTLCASTYVRTSRQPTPWIARALGLVLCRCESCWRLFLLRRRLLAQLDASEAQP